MLLKELYWSIFTLIKCFSVSLVEISVLECILNIPNTVKCILNVFCVHFFTSIVQYIMRKMHMKKMYFLQTMFKWQPIPVLTKKHLFNMHYVIELHACIIPWIFNLSQTPVHPNTSWKIHFLWKSDSDSSTAWQWINWK